MVHVDFLLDCVENLVLRLFDLVVAIPFLISLVNERLKETLRVILRLIQAALAHSRGGIFTLRSDRGHQAHVRLEKGPPEVCERQVTKILLECFLELAEVRRLRLFCTILVVGSTVVWVKCGTRRVNVAAQITRPLVKQNTFY